MPTVFLSSTASDLQVYRDAVRKVIQGLDGFSCIAMEDFGSVELAAQTYCAKAVESADVLVGIVGLRHGSSPPGRQESFTELEYEAASAHGIPRLMFVTPEDFQIPGHLREPDAKWHRQQDFRRRVLQQSIAASFSSADVLATTVVASLHNWTKRQAVVHLLSIPQRHWRADMDPPGALLRADYGIVPFHARQAETENLCAWLEGDRPLAVRLYTGAGGMGKTRLALEACKTYGGQGWQAGFIDHRQIRPGTTDWPLLLGTPSPCLVVVDYAETGRELVAELVAAALARDGGKLRLILLARGGGDWWEGMKREGRGVGDVFAGPATSRISLQPLAMAIEARRDSYRLAVASLAAALRVEPPKDEPNNYEAAHFERVLLLHMAALAAIDGVPVKDEDGILDYVLARERRFWEGLAASRGLARPVADGIGRAMAAITLGGGADDKTEALAVFKGLAFFDGQPQAVLEAMAHLLHDSYPGPKWIEPVLPDLLGEHLIEKELGSGEQDLFELVFGPAPQ